MHSSSSTAIKHPEDFDQTINTARFNLLDFTLSKNTENIAYASLCPFVHYQQIKMDNELIGGKQHILEFSRESQFAIWSLQFSQNDKEILAGTSDCSIYVYDIEQGCVLYKIRGHDDDVNSVCFIDEGANVVCSGSDDSLIKVWDRRSRGCSGFLVGHTEGSHNLILVLLTFLQIMMEDIFYPTAKIKK
jgi:WD repeat-containing protein 23